VIGGYDEHGKPVQGRYTINDLRFVDNQTVVVDYDRSWIDPDGPPSAVFHEGVDGAWRQVPGAQDPLPASLPIKVEALEAINQPPQILAAVKASTDSHVIWDLNPQFKEVELGEAEVIHGTDANGIEWEAGLVKPLGYESGTRYPLVIQTHGFDKKQFLSNGSYTTAFAARAMAAAGIMVVQVSGNPLHNTTPLEGPDQVTLYRSIVNTLADKGLVDPKRVGAIGFSRTGFHVLSAMTAVPPLLAAASNTDVSTFGYFEFVFSVDREPVSSLEKIYGGSPLDEEGMKKWSAQSPLFNMSETKTPLLLVQPGIVSVLFDLEPYAVLRYLHKPVDLIMIQSDSHVMSNPRQRFLSETLNVDWFRFWLQGYEDPDPAKKEQYERWRGLRKMKEENDAKEKAAGDKAGAIN
jgi:dipeptidyl aminopeptidase/acylaminoacyl peptidase